MWFLIRRLIGGAFETLIRRAQGFYCLWNLTVEFLHDSPLPCHIKVAPLGVGIDGNCSVCFLTFSFSLFSVFVPRHLERHNWKVTQCIVYIPSAPRAVHLAFLYNQRYCPSRGHLACSPPPQCKCSPAMTARCYERLY